MLVLSFFAVLGPGKSLLRQGVVWLVAVTLVGSFAAGIAIASMMETSIHIGGVGSMLVSLFAIPAILCACQAPLWGLRYFARWRTTTSDGSDKDLGQISIRGMLAATAVVAVVLGLCRLGLSLEALQWDEGRYGQPLAPLVWWTGIGIASVSTLALSLVVLPVTSLLVLRSQSVLLGLVYATAYLAACRRDVPRDRKRHQPRLSQRRRLHDTLHVLPQHHRLSAHLARHLPLGRLSALVGAAGGIKRR